MTVISNQGITLDVRKKINLESVSCDLFDDVALCAAKIIGQNKESNKPSQIRRFYDELCAWHDKIGQAQDKEQCLAENLPFIRMMNAKIAYAKGRNQKEDRRDPTVKDLTGLVDKNFVDLFGHCIKQVKDYKTLKNFKLFFEAFLGFYKVERPKD